MRIFFFIILILLFIFNTPYFSRWIGRMMRRYIMRKMGMDPSDSRFSGSGPGSQDSYGANSQRRAGGYEPNSSAEHHPVEKVDLSELAKRKFEKENSNDYAEFEELPDK